MLRVPLRSRNFEQLRPALKRWIKVTGAWNLLVAAGCVIYFVLVSSRHGRALAWVAPPIGAVFGSALALQLVVTPIARAARGQTASTEIDSVDKA
jgi:hypothetical protein